MVSRVTHRLKEQAIKPDVHLRFFTAEVRKIAVNYFIVYNRTKSTGDRKDVERKAYTCSVTGKDYFLSVSKSIS